MESLNVQGPSIRNMLLCKVSSNGAYSPIAEMDINQVIPLGLYENEKVHLNHD